MSLRLTAGALAAMLVSALITGLVRKYAWAHGVIDLPNERSSHRTPTPRGGGVSIVLTTCAALGLLAWLGAIAPKLLIAMCGGGLGVAAVGFVDDRRRVPPGIRLAVHVAAALWALAWLGGLPPLRFAHDTIALGWAGDLLGVLGIVWVLNLFNFMDGIDGIAASEAVFVAWCGALLTCPAPAAAGMCPAAVLLGATSLGFLCWNWPPARIFMGDVGSGYLGYMLAVLTLAAARADPGAVWIWLILGGAFFADATVTVLQRFVRGERIHHAHRDHAYQRLARRWGSHAKVTVLVLLLDVAWLLPWAVVAQRLPQYALAALFTALAPLAVLVAAMGRKRTHGPRVTEEA